MQKTLGRKLLTNIVLMILMIIMISVAGIICIQILKTSSNKIVHEYFEMEVIHKLNPSLQELVFPADNFIMYNNHDDLILYKFKQEEFKALISQLRNDISPIHNNLINEIETLSTEINQIVFETEKAKTPASNITKHEAITKLHNIFNLTNSLINSLLDETRHEIDEAIETNSTAIFHSTITVVLIMLILIFSSILWGNRFVKNITSPILNLIDFTNKVSTGDFNSRIKTSFNNELDNLANSLNLMTENLDSTTISRDYFDSIIKSITDSIVVTDEKGIIKMINNSTLELSGFEKEEVIDHSLCKLLLNSKDKDCEKLTDELDKIIAIGSSPESETFFTSKEGKKIPIAFTSSILKINSKIKGTVCLAHDISQKMEFDMEIERERKQRQNLISEAQENERLRIATELHDGLGHMLTALQYSIENKFKTKYKEDKEFQLNLDDLQNQLDIIVDETKSISHDLLPMLLKDFGLVIAIKNLVNNINKNDEVKIWYDSFNFSERINPNLEKLFYRLAQEGLNNILKHSKAKNAYVQLIKHEDSVVLLMDDDGIGFNKNDKGNKKNKSGIGLLSMSERVSSYNGTLTIESSEDNGTEILIEIPI